MTEKGGKMVNKFLITVLKSLINKGIVNQKDIKKKLVENIEKEGIEEKLGITINIDKFMEKHLTLKD